MEFYLAPMEGLTGFVYRSAFCTFFSDIDKYFSPFLVPTQKKVLRTREKEDIAPEHNKGMNFVPQILTHRSDYFLEAVKMLNEMGYQEINLNAGCPSPTVVTKGKGAGLLKDIGRLDAFLEESFKGLEREKLNCRISIKTRIGMEDAKEFPNLLRIFNRYPISELILHPRVGAQKYTGSPDYEAFAYALEYAEHPLCYNGDIYSPEDYENFCQLFPEVKKIMIGRGLMADPSLIRQIKGGDKASGEELKAFHDSIYQSYLETSIHPGAAVPRMKELWTYLGRNMPEEKKALKRIKKAKNIEEYEEAVRMIFSKSI
jgi:tRNA-dihydrouridine synthase